jgi:hypothetical protein
MITLIDAFVSFWYLSLFWVCLWYPTGITRGKNNLPGYYYVGQGPQTTFPVWVLPSAATWGSHYFGNTRVLLGCYPTQNGSSSQNYFVGSVGWTCLHLDKLICKHCRDKNCCSFASQSYISFIIWDHGKESTPVLFMFLDAILTELQNHNLGSYLQSFKIMTYRASKSQSWVTLPIESTVAIPVLYAMFFFGQFCDIAKVAIIHRTI